MTMTRKEQRELDRWRALAEARGKEVERYQSSINRLIVENTALRIAMVHIHDAVVEVKERLVGYI